MAKQEPYWDGIWAYPLMSFDYKELELKYAGALVDRFRKIVMPIDEWHHVVIFIDGVKEVDKIKVTHKKSTSLDAFIIGALLFFFGIAQILASFGSWFLTGATVVTLLIFISGTMLATAGLVSWIFGIKDVK